MEDEVSQEQISDLLNDAEIYEETFWDRKELVISYKLKNGITILGRANFVDADNIESGRQVARKEAEKHLRQKLIEEGGLR